ncbi:MAG TPA: hypothetical protein VIM73_20965 [Polyangiaceae bacterium]
MSEHAVGPHSTHHTALTALDRLVIEDPLAAWRSSVRGRHRNVHPESSIKISFSTGVVAMTRENAAAFPCHRDGAAQRVDALGPGGALDASGTRQYSPLASSSPFEQEVITPAFSPGPFGAHRD